MKAIIFDAFGTIFKITKGGSVRAIIKNIIACGAVVDEKSFNNEWKTYYRKHTIGDGEFMTERDIFTSRIRMFYDRYGVSRSAECDADTLIVRAFEREAYPEVKTVIDALMDNYLVFIGSNTDNDVLENVMRRNDIKVHKVYTSENLKCYKPNTKFYKNILDDHGLSPKEVLFVGDSITDDILGPKSIGIKTAWIDRDGIGGDMGQDYTITNFGELLQKVL